MMLGRSRTLVLTCWARSRSLGEQRRSRSTPIPYVRLGGRFRGPSISQLREAKQLLRSEWQGWWLTA